MCFQGVRLFRDFTINFDYTKFKKCVVYTKFLKNVVLLPVCIRVNKLDLSAGKWFSSVCCYINNHSKPAIVPVSVEVGHTK